LTNLLAELQVIMKTSVNPQIEWDRHTGTSPLGGFHSALIWTRNGYSSSISVNTHVLTYTDAVEAFRVISHELRHAYQFEAGRRPGTHVISQQTSDIWRRNHNSPVPQGVFVNGWPSREHMRSPIEFDAYFFTGHISIADFNSRFGRPEYFYGWSATFPFTLS